jgi:hypothetical protein
MGEGRSEGSRGQPAARGCYPLSNPPPQGGRESAYRLFISYQVAGFIDVMSILSPALA